MKEYRILEAEAGNASAVLKKAVKEGWTPGNPTTAIVKSYTHTSHGGDAETYNTVVLFMLISREAPSEQA